MRAASVPRPRGPRPSARSATGRHGAEERTGQVGGAGCDKLAICLDGGISTGRESPAGGDGLGEAHQRNAERAGQKLGNKPEAGKGDRRERLGDEAHGRDAKRLQADQPREPNPRAHRHQRSRQTGPQALHRQQSKQRGDGNCQREQRCIRQMVHDTQDIAEETLLRDMHAEQLRHLIEHDHQSDAGLEAGQDRRRDEVGDEADAKRRGRDEENAGERGERRSRSDQLPGSPSGTTIASSVAVRIARVVVELTLRTREVPSRA